MGLLWEKRGKEFEEQALCVFFWMIWKAREKVDFEEEELSIQRLKNSFVYFLWLETKLFIKDGPSTLVDFIDWVGTYLG